MLQILTNLLHVSANRQKFVLRTKQISISRKQKALKTFDLGLANKGHAPLIDDHRFGVGF